MLGAALLMVGGLAGIVAAWNAARPLVDPTRRYSPSWLPAMVVAELAPFWLIVHVVVLLVGIALGGAASWVGRVGVGLLALAIVLLVWIIVRSLIGVRHLRSMLAGAVEPARGRARLVGLPIRTPPSLVEEHGVEWCDGLTLDLVHAAGRPDRSPVLVYVHGGGWTGGDPQRQARDLYHALALDGWTVVAVRYPFTPHVSVEEQIATIEAAVAWVRSDLVAHGVTPSVVALAGGSAGGHLAAMAALSPAGERVDAFVGIYGVYDMANRNRTRAHWGKTSREVMLATVDEAPERYRAVSPLDQVHPAAPPMLIVHGTHDTLVPIAEGEQFVIALEAAGADVELVRVFGAQHAFDAVSSVTSRTTAAVIRDWLRTNVLDRDAPRDGGAPRG